MLAKGDSEFLLGAASEATGRGDAYNDEAAGIPHQVGFSKYLHFPPFSRLTEARAKMELREEATKEDAEEVIIMILEMVLVSKMVMFGNLRWWR